MSLPAAVQPPPQTKPAAVPSRRRSFLRSAATFVFLIVLLVLIGGYVYVTDSTRVRAYAQQKLSQLTGADVTIGRASLSIFEGLRLDDLKITADGAEIFSAKVLQVDYDPHALLRGRIDAGRVLAVEPHVRLIENVDRREWNFEPLYKRQATLNNASTDFKNNPMRLPQIVVRNARVDYAQVVDGQKTDVGTLHLEGQFAPDTQDNYRFTLQSRVGLKGTFPIADGFLKTDGSRMSVELRDVEFVDEIKTILPAHVRDFWERHKLAGRMNRTRLDYARLPDGTTAFTVVTDLAGVQLTVPPGNWMSDSDRARIARWHDNFAEIAGPAMGGSAIAGELIDAMVPTPMELRSVDASFVFTDDHIRIRNLVGRLDNNRVHITGDIDGYSANAGFAMRIESLPEAPLVLKESPAFIDSMPWPIQELYYRFRPVGTGTFFMEIARHAGEVKTRLKGELTFHDSAFAFDRFPYPADRASGTLRFENDPVTGEPAMEIVDVRCRGYTGGPNQSANVTITGRVTPLDMTAGANIRIAGTGLVSDERLVEAMPPPTRKAVRNFDSAHTGLLPKFSGDFDCHVHRDIGHGKEWLVTTHLDIRDGEGSFVGFPYQVKNVTASITIFDDHLDLEKTDMPCDGGSASLTGLITWSKHDAKTGLPLIQTDLTLRARHVALNDRLLDALPPGKGTWLKKIGLDGTLDLDGKIVPSAPDSDDPAVNLQVKLAGGTAHLPNNAIKLTGLEGSAQVDPARAVITDLKGFFGPAQIGGSGTVIWTGDEPQLTAAATVRGLLIDETLTRALPPSAGKLVRSLHAKGAVDVDLSYNAAAHDAYRAEIRPHDLTLKPDFFAVPLDRLSGSVLVDPGHVTLHNITAHSNAATLSTDGTIETETGDAVVSLAGRDLTLTPAVTNALPGALRDVVKSASLTGQLAFDCSKLMLHGLSATTQPAANNDDIEFETKFWMQPVTFKLGVGFDDVRGVVAVKGNIHGGDLNAIDGQLNLDSLKIAGRSVSNVYAELHKAADRDILQIGKIDAKIAGGNVAGQIDTSLTKVDPRFALNLQVRGAKISELTGEAAGTIDGRLTASLAMEAKWSGTSGRRGRGDVQVDGRNMYQVPVLFGLMQVANLTLPNRTPIQQASLRYTIEGPRLILDQIDLRATENVMQGSGELNFDTKKVDLRLSLANSAADALPIFGELIKAARQDLLQIRVKGTLQTPKIYANAFNMFSTTVDEVNAEK